MRLLFVLLVLVSMTACSTRFMGGTPQPEPTPTCVTMGGTVLTTLAACDSARRN
jgi:hypothetical protein